MKMAQKYAVYAGSFSVPACSRGGKGLERRILEAAMDGEPRLVAEYPDPLSARCAGAFTAGHWGSRARIDGSEIKGEVVWIEAADDAGTVDIDWIAPWRGDARGLILGEEAQA